MRAVCTVKLKFLVIILPHESSVHCARKLLMETEGRSRDQPTMEKTFAQNHFTMMDHFTMIDRSCDQSTIEKTFAQNHFTMMDRSRDQSTMEKTFAPNHFTMVDDKKLHNLIFSYDLKKN